MWNVKKIKVVGFWTEGVTVPLAATTHDLPTAAEHAKKGDANECASCRPKVDARAEK
jgi:hypothetical protein